MATKAELLAEISTMYEIVGAPFETNSSDEHIPELINSYSVIVYESGLSEVNKKPVLSSKYINFIVYDEYQPGEAAYYVKEEPTNDVNSDFSGDDSLISISKIYDSVTLRKRIRSAIMVAAQNIFEEDIPSSLITSDAIHDQYDVEIADSSLFYVGQSVILLDTNDGPEEHMIASISGNVLTMAEVLLSDFKPAENGTVTGTDNDNRRKWAANALLEPDKYTLAMLSFAALDSDVQTNGNSVTDIVLQSIVNDNINVLAYAIRIS